MPAESKPKAQRPTLKSLLIIYLAIWPLVTVIPRLMQGVLGEWPLLAGELTTIVIVLLMSYVMMPLSTRFVARVEGLLKRKPGEVDARKSPHS